MIYYYTGSTTKLNSNCNQPLNLHQTKTSVFVLVALAVMTLVLLVSDFFTFIVVGIPLLIGGFMVEFTLFWAMVKYHGHGWFLEDTLIRKGYVRRV